MVVAVADVVAVLVVSVTYAFVSYSISLTFQMSLKSLQRNKNFMFKKTLSIASFCKQMQKNLLMVTELGSQRDFPKEFL